MHITLIGMSNIGKSHWSKRLASQHGFERLHCDGLVERKLVDILRPLGISGIDGVAKWMGQPYDPQYAETSARYLACEIAVMQDILNRIDEAPEGKNFVIDTTGSVIYTGEMITRAMGDRTQMFYLQASPAHADKMFRRYIENPKPVIWDDVFMPLAGETPQDTLRRCYPVLLETRARRYERLAHTVIPYEQHRHHKADPAEIFGL
ncbi:MAG: hypothetical protein AB7H77_07125 [Bdellovibrionales bacterium]